MANIHIMANDGTRWAALFHILIPATNNAAGLSWQTVVLRNLGTSTSLPDGDGLLGTISSTEKANILSGAVTELLRQFKFTGQPSLTELDSIYNSIKTDFLSGIQAKYNRYGVTR